ncbi:MAG TPA: hypothetical protein VHN77_11960 [Phycisphaerales bacterium]|nr:hypothetical protein [Phycisphaerales bacterium]
MDPFKIQRSLAKQLLTSKPGMAAGMKVVLGALERGCPKADVAACRGVPWERALQRWVAWMDGLVRKSPPPALGLLWFETPSELNPAVTSVSGWTELGPASDSYGIEEERVWPIDKKGFTLPQGLHLVPEIELAWKRMGLREDTDGAAPDDQLLAAVYAVASSCTLLLVINGLPRTRLAAGIGAGSAIGVTMGWASGDFEAVGGFGGGRWSAMPKGRKTPPVKRAGPPDDLEFYEPRKYLARGGDARWRDSKTGETMLHNLSYTATVLDAKALIEAGADVNARTKSGETVLHKVGAADMPLFRYLLSAGADPNAASKDGQSVWDRLLQDGRHTVKHLQCMFDAGAKEPRSNPLMRIADSGFPKGSTTSQERAQAAFWIKRGWPLNGSPSPLWCALRGHAANVAWMLKQQREHKDAYGSDESKYDTTAIMLLDLGANPNERLKKSSHGLIPDNATPLMVRRYDDDRLVRALLKHGADPHARCAKGKTALDYAQQAARTPEKPGCTAAAKVAAVLERAMRTPPRRARKRR